MELVDDDILPWEKIILGRSYYSGLKFPRSVFKESVFKESVFPVTLTLFISKTMF